MSVAQTGAVESSLLLTKGGSLPASPDLTNTLRSEIRAHLVRAENLSTTATQALRLDQLPHVGTCIRRAQRELATAAEKLRAGYVEPVEDLLKLKDDLLKKQGERIQQLLGTVNELTQQLHGTSAAHAILQAQAGLSPADYEAHRLYLAEDAPEPTEDEP